MTAFLDRVGAPYFFGDNGPNAFDCSSGVLDAMNRSGFKRADATADMLYRDLAPVPEADAKAGDLAFYGPGGGTPGARATHVVMLLASRGRAIIGANGGDSFAQRGKTETGDAFIARRAEYVARMAKANASVRLGDHRAKGARYRVDLLGYGRLPWEASKLVVG